MAQTRSSFKKAVLTGCLIGATAVAITFMLTFGLSQLMSAEAPNEYTVRSGDTLSEIAEKCRPDGMTINDYMVDIQLKNNLSSNQVHTDQELVLPKGATC